MNLDVIRCIFALLPEEDQEEALLYALELVYARGEWQLACEALERILHLQVNKKLYGRAILLGIKAALRLSKPEIALERFQRLLALKPCAASRALQMESLFLISSHVLPCRAEKLAVLWEELGASTMSASSRQLWARTGAMLEKTFTKNGNPVQANKIRDLATALPGRTDWT